MYSMTHGLLKEVDMLVMNINNVQHGQYLYSRHLIESVVIPAANGLLGELNPNLNDRFEICYPNVAFKVTNMYLNNNLLRVKLIVLDTPAGKIMLDIINNNLEIRFSLRYISDVTDVEGFKVVRENGFNLIALDAFTNYTALVH